MEEERSIRVGVDRTDHWTWGAWNLFQFEYLALMALFMFGMLVQGNTQTTWFAIGGCVFVALAVVAPRSTPATIGVSITARGAALLAIFFSVYGFALYGGVQRTVTVLVCIVVGGAVFGGLLGMPRLVGPLGRMGAVILLLSVLLSIGFTSITVRQQPIDVLDLHRSAAAELAHGSNPYVSARAKDTSPLAEPDAEFEGYVYPPTALAAYVAGQWGFGDPRWTTILSAAAFVILLTAPWRRMDTSSSAAAISLASAFVALPHLPLVVNSGWTDLLALPLLLAAALAWQERSVLSAVLLGLGLSTKTYFALALPVLVVWPDRVRIRRLAVVAVVVVVTFMPFLIADAPSVLSIVRGEGLDAPYRPDSLGLAGLAMNVPRWASYALAAIVGVLFGRRGGSESRFFITLAAVFGVVFLTGFQAFINYWFLVVGLVIIALVPIADSTKLPDRKCWV